MSKKYISYAPFILGWFVFSVIFSKLNLPPLLSLKIYCISGLAHLIITVPLHRHRTKEFLYSNYPEVCENIIRKIYPELNWPKDQSDVKACFSLRAFDIVMRKNLCPIEDEVLQNIHRNNNYRGVFTLLLLTIIGMLLSMSIFFGK